MRRNPVLVLIILVAMLMALVIVALVLSLPGHMTPTPRTPTPEAHELRNLDGHSWIGDGTASPTPTPKAADRTAPSSTTPPGTSPLPDTKVNVAGSSSSVTVNLTLETTSPPPVQTGVNLGVSP